MRLCVLAAGTKNLKDHRNLLLERRAMVARHSVLPARTPDTNYAPLFCVRDFLCGGETSARCQGSRPTSGILGMRRHAVEVLFVASVTRAPSRGKSRKVNKRFELQMLQKAGAGADSRLDFVFTILGCRDALAGEDYFSPTLQK